MEKLSLGESSTVCPLSYLLFRNLFYLRLNQKLWETILHKKITEK